MMKFTEGETVFNNGSTFGFLFRNDMGRIEQFTVVKMTKGTAGLIRCQNSLPKTALMQSCSNNRGKIGSLSFIVFSN